MNRKNPLMLFAASMMLWAALAGSASAAKQVSPQANPFKNGVELVNYMRSQGIEPTKVNWRHVEQLCAGQLSYGAEAYNRCKYENARVSYYHAADKRECAVVAKYDRPRDNYRRGYRRYHHVRVSKSGYSNGPGHREASVVKCMRNLGWASAKHWRLGAR